MLFDTHVEKYASVSHWTASAYLLLVTDLRTTEPTMRNIFKRAFLITIAIAAVVAATGVFSEPYIAGASQQTQFPLILDPQVVRDQDDMTWDDFKPIPGTDWANEGKVGSQRQMRLAILTADFADQPFVMTLPKNSDLYGNPQIDPVTRAQIPKFYEDLYNKPSAMNKGHTIHEYWMEQSRGRIGITATAFGPYRMPLKVFQYGGFGAENMPAGHEPSSGLSRQIDSLWRAEQGDSIAGKFDIVLRMFAGYDETATWQEFGEMKFQTREDIPRQWGNPDTTKPRWVRTRYVEWTSWNAGQWLWSNSAIVQGEAISTIRHEISHFAFRIGDNYNNPFVQPYRRAPAGPWDLMDRGSFNGPGGPHRRWVSPPTEGGSMSAGLMLRQRLNFRFVDSAAVPMFSRDGLAKSGLALVNITARAIEPLPNSVPGIVVRLDGAAPQDRTPADDPATNPLSSGTPNFNFYTVEVVQRLGTDSFTPDNGVLIAKNKTQASSVGGPNGYSTFTWVIDAKPQDINKIDFRRPNGEAVMRTVADYRQLNDALFHAGLNSGSEFQWTDPHNGLHFMVVDIQRDPRGVISYTVAVKSLDTPASGGPHTRGVELSLAGGQTGASVERDGMLSLAVRNTGRAGPIPADAHPAGLDQYFAADVYRLSVTASGSWEGKLANELVAAKNGESAAVPIYVRRGPQTGTSTIELKAVSVSDTTKVARLSCTFPELRCR